MIVAQLTLSKEWGIIEWKYKNQTRSKKHRKQKKSAVVEFPRASSTRPRGGMICLRVVGGHICRWGVCFCLLSYITTEYILNEYGVGRIRYALV